MSKIKIINENYIHAQDVLFGGEMGKLVINQKQRYLRGVTLPVAATGIVMGFTPAKKDLYSSYSVPQGECYNDEFTWRNGKQSAIAGSIQINWIGHIIETIILKPTEQLERERCGWYGKANKLSKYVVTADKSMELAKEQKIIDDRETEYNNFVSNFQSNIYSGVGNHQQRIALAVKSAYKEAVDKCLELFDREDWYENRFALWADFANWIEKDYKNKYHTYGIEQVLFGNGDTWSADGRYYNHEDEREYDNYSIHFTMANNFDPATMCDIANVPNDLEKEIKEYISNTPNTLLTNEEVKKFNYQQYGCSMKNAEIVKRSAYIDHKSWTNPVTGQYIKIRMRQGKFHIS